MVPTTELVVSGKNEFIEWYLTKYPRKNGCCKKLGTMMLAFVKANHWKRVLVSYVLEILEIKENPRIPDEK